MTRVTHEREQLIDELLAQETAEIERTPIGRQVAMMPAVKEEGDTIVVPIIEEVLVVERRLFLKKEVRIRRVRSTQRHQETVTLPPPRSGGYAPTGGAASDRGKPRVWRKAATVQSGEIA